MPSCNGWPLRLRCRPYPAEIQSRGDGWWPLDERSGSGKGNSSKMSEKTKENDESIELKNLLWYAKNILE